MSVASSFEEGLRNAFAPTAHGIVGLVDQLLAFCRRQDTMFEWKGGRLCCRPLEGEGETVEVPLPKAAFRPMLARVAALCNRHERESVSPYGGEGEIVVGGDPFLVIFTNTPSTQRLEVRADHRGSFEKVLALIQKSNARYSNSLVADILDLGQGAVATMRDPKNWVALEQVIQVWYAPEIVALAGAPLAIHWYHSSNGDVAFSAKDWVRRHWAECWDILPDQMKRELVQYFEDELSRALRRMG
jgi:hypothetical protein